MNKLERGIVVPVQGEVAGLRIIQVLDADGRYVPKEFVRLFQNGGRRVKIVDDALAWSLARDSRSKQIITLPAIGDIVVFERRRATRPRVRDAARRWTPIEHYERMASILDRESLARLTAELKLRHQAPCASCRRPIPIDSPLDVCFDCMYPVEETMAES